MATDSKQAKPTHGVYHGRYDWSTTKPSIAVIHAISTFLDTGTVSLHEEMDTTLYDHIDPDALNTLISNGTHVKVTFTIDEYLVEIDGKTVSVVNLNAPADIIGT